MRQNCSARSIAACPGEGVSDTIVGTMDILSLYEKYRDELKEKTRIWKQVYFAMSKKGFGTGFRDVEGEIMYMLIREARPGVVFEISPNSGWSTNYILAALTENKHGVVHSFELIPSMFGIPTEKAIRGNQWHGWDQSRLHVHIGDASKLAGTVPGSIDFLLLDSCHEDWFARWYISDVIPRVRGTVIIQDIAFVDRLERSTEASEVWKWLEENSIGTKLLGKWEQDLRATRLRAGFLERTPVRTNSIVLRHPFEKGTMPVLQTGPDALLDRAKEALKAGDAAHAEASLCEAMSMLRFDRGRADLHGLWLQAAQICRKIGWKDEAHRCAKDAFGAVIESEQSRWKRLLPSTCIQLILGREWRLAMQCFGCIVFEPGSRMPFLRRVLRLFW